MQTCAIVFHTNRGWHFGGESVPDQMFSESYEFRSFVGIRSEEALGTSQPPTYPGESSYCAGEGSRAGHRSAVACTRYLVIMIPGQLEQQNVESSGIRPL